MSSFLSVNLDTTKPYVEIYAPEYAAINSVMEILVVANEDLDIYQDIYMSYEGVSVPLTFSQETKPLNLLFS